LIATLVPAVMLLVTLWYYQASINLMVLVFLLLFCLIGFCATTLYQRINYQFYTLSNLLEGMSHGDYSLRGRRISEHDALGQLVGQINALADTLTEQRFAAMESQLLVEKVIQHIDVAILAVDDKQHIALINPAAESLLNVSQSQALQKPINVIGAQSLLETKSHQVTELGFAAGRGQFQVIRDQYREHGHQHELFFITNVQMLLREHERQAWQNLIRVLSHEINNSLAPIASFATTLQGLARKEELAPDFAENLHHGLGVVSERAKRLKEFIDSYRRLSHLPEPKKEKVDLKELVAQLVPLLSQREICQEITLDQSILLDPVQMEQVLINLFKNADEAMANKAGAIVFRAYQESDTVVIEVVDSGTGIQKSDNLFTPFYTTKKHGSGIGLVLSRQIIEAHQGYLDIENRIDAQGVVVKIVLPH